MSDVDGQYVFPAGLPIEPIESGTTLLVAGPAFSNVDALARSLVVSGTTDGEGALFISTTMTSTKLVRACRQWTPELDTDFVGIIDCSGQEIGQADDDLTVKYVSTQSDLTGIGMKFSALYESLYAASTGGRIRTGLISLSSLSMYVDLRTLFQFAHTLSARIDSAGGLGVFTIDPSTHDDQTVNTLSQVADARIEIREADAADADGELRIKGLPEQPSGWQPFSLATET